jgi:hypothetical protein
VPFGDVLGTLRYMSPEQALAKHGLVDHRTDVYSLGVTLYELLTGTPAVGGKDREEILNRITLEESQPPRSFDSTIPRDLETIVLKAMAKSAFERYATARELADDLRRLLQDQPIRARRPSALQRMRKWARRYRAVVRTALVCLLFAVLAVTGGAGWAVRDRTSRREEAERQAREALRDAFRLLQEEKWAEGLQAALRAESVLSTAPESELRQEARELAADLAAAGQLEAVRLKMSESIYEWQLDWSEMDSAYAKAFAAYRLDDERLDPHEVAARIRARPVWSQVAAALDSWAEARRQAPAHGYAGVRPHEMGTDTERIMAVVRALDPDAWRDRLRYSLALKDLAARRQALVDLASSAPVGNTTAFSIVLLARAVADSGGSLGSVSRQGSFVPALVLLRRAWRQYPGDFWVNYELATRLAMLVPRDEDEALRYATAAVSLRPQSFGAHLTLGMLLIRKGRHMEAIEEMQEAVRLEGPNQRRHPASRWLRRAERLAAVEGRLSALLKGEAQPKDANEYWALAFLYQTRDDRLPDAARCYVLAFAAQPKMAEDLSCADRYNAACAAAITGRGQGKEAAVSDAERVYFRHQAFQWLQADLAARRRMVNLEPRLWADVYDEMQHWLIDGDFEGVRGPAALARLPEPERREWHKLWEEVESLRQRAEAERLTSP